MRMSDPQLPAMTCRNLTSTMSKKARHKIACIVCFHLFTVPKQTQGIYVLKS